MREETIAVLLTCILLLPGCIASEDGVDLFGVEYREPPEAPDFTLFDQNGELFTLSEYEGKVVVVAFIYTSCPDICLIISANLDYIDQNLDGYSDEVVIISVTIDPARDTISHLAEWTEQMGYDWHHPQVAESPIRIRCHLQAPPQGCPGRCQSRLLPRRSPHLSYRSGGRHRSWTRPPLSRRCH